MQKFGLDADEDDDDDEDGDGDEDDEGGDPSSWDGRSLSEIDRTLGRMR